IGFTRPRSTTTTPARGYSAGGRPEPNTDLVVDRPTAGTAEYPRAGVVVVDRGRVNPMADAREESSAPEDQGVSATNGAADLVVCVTRPTVAGVHALGRCLAELDAADVSAMGVLREE